MSIPILITAAGTAPALSVLKALRIQTHLPVHLVATDLDPLSPARLMADTFLQSPPISHPDFFPFIRHTCQRLAIQAIIPILDEELRPFAAQASALSRDGVQVILTDQASVTRCLDKLQASQVVQEAGLLTPETWPLADCDPLRLPYPVVVKPRDTKRRGEVPVVETPAALRSLVESLEADQLVQPYLRGREFTVELLLTRRGELCGVYPRERLQVKAGISTRARFSTDPALVSAAARAARALGLCGPANIQFMRTDAGDVFLEANPKFPGGGGLTLAAGVNTPLFHVLEALGLPQVPPPVIPDGTLVVRYYEEQVLPPWPGNPPWQGD